MTGDCMKIDFHVHTSKYSGCASSGPEEQVRSAIRQGVDVMFITEHMRLFPQELIDDMNKRYAPFRIYQGIEVTIRDETFEDFIVIGVHDRRIENDHWTYRRLWEFVKKKGGGIIIAHPFRFDNCVDSHVYDYPPDAVEILSSNIGEKGYNKRIKLATQLGKPLISNSDSHNICNTGCYSNEFPDWCTDENRIIQALIVGDYKCATLEK